jgi:predicted Zn-dependent protease
VRRFLPCIVLLAAALPARAATNDDPVVRALQDEIKRSMEGLALPDAKKPYYMGYLLDDRDDVHVEAALGALLEDRHTRWRMLHTQVRVGDYALDSSNFAASPFNPFNWRGMVPTIVPLEADYASVRRAAWLAADQRYKAAVDALEKKTAMRASQEASPDRVDDFSREPAAVLEVEAPPATFDRERYRALAKALAGVGRELGDVQTSTASVGAAHDRRSFVSSEGSSSVEMRVEFRANLMLQAQADDGMIVSNYMSTRACSSKSVPTDDALLAEARRTASELEEIRRAPLADDYTGPVLVEGVAAPQVLRMVLEQALDGTPPQESASEGRSHFQSEPSELAGRVGLRILPAGFGLVDDPSLDAIGAIPLAGCHRIDDEGVPAQRVVVVEDGVFRSFLMSRTPRKGFGRSNGHARENYVGTTARPSNLILSTKNTFAERELRARLLAEAKAAKRPYAVVVGLLEDSDVRFLESGGMPLPWGGGGERGTLALVMWKLLPDGKMERVRGGRIAEIPLRALKEILAAGSVPAVFSTGGYTSDGESFVAPALLFKELEILHPRAPTTKAPAVPRPDVSSEGTAKAVAPTVR